MQDPAEQRFPGARLAAELLAGLLGAALIVAAIRADTHWFDRHFLPDMFHRRPKQLRLLWAGRSVVGAIGLWLLVVVRPWLGRLALWTPALRLGMALMPTLIAILLAVGVTEAVLRSSPWRAAQEAPVSREPVRRRDPTFGWLFVSSREGHVRSTSGREVSYAFDAHGYRVRRPGDQVDLARPSVVFTGESVIFGDGLDWDESIPGQVRALTHLQTVDMAVEAYAPDQAYLRLRAELPQLRRPVAVVTIFIPSLFGRILDDDRPHLDADLQWRPAAQGWRLAAFAKRLVPYRSADDLDRGLNTTRAIYRSTIALAKARGAVPIILAPIFLPEPPAELAIRRKVLDEAGISYLPVPLDPAWRLPHNKHPDARGDRAMAEAIAKRLQQARDGAAPRGW